MHGDRHVHGCWGDTMQVDQSEGTMNVIVTQMIGVLVVRVIKGFCGVGFRLTAWIGVPRFH